MAAGIMDLKRLVSHTGTLKNSKDYITYSNTTSKNGATSKIDSTFIIFTNELLGSMDILAVVKRKKN